MTPRQWKILLALALAVGAVAIGVGLVALFGDGGRSARVGTAGDETPTTSSSVASSTTVSLRPIMPSTTDLRAADTTEAPPETTTAPAPVVGSDGAVLGRSTEDEERRRAPGGGCATMARTGYRTDCGEVSAGGDELVWMVEERLTTGGLRASVLRRLDQSTYQPVLEALDDGPGGPARFAAITVRVEDVSGDGTSEIVFGFRGQGSGAILDLDVVEAPGRVILHRTLDEGRAAVVRGRLDDWAAEFGPNDAACCPSRFRHTVIRRVDGAWRIVESRREAAGGVPRGDFE